MTKENIKELRSKIIRGIDLAYKKLLIEKQKEDGEIVISRNGKIITIKASDISKY
jgi:hypothetical protein